MISISSANKLPINSKKPPFQGGWGIQIYDRAQKSFQASAEVFSAALVKISLAKPL
jgi:hypothetical protein